MVRDLTVPPMLLLLPKLIRRRAGKIYSVAGCVIELPPSSAACCWPRKIDC